MPRRAAHPCSVHGCPALVTQGARCPDHERAQDRARGTAAQRGYGARHREWRAAILARDRACRACGSTADPVADHIVPLRQGGTWAHSNGQRLCASCHNRKRQRESMEARNG